MMPEHNNDKAKRVSEISAALDNFGAASTREDVIAEADIAGDDWEDLIDIIADIPIPGEAWSLRTNVGFEEIGPGEWVHIYRDPKTLLPRNCPVKPLGKTPEGCWFLDPTGGILMLPKSAGKGDMDHLFAPFNDYLFWAWPQKKPIEEGKGKDKVVIGWEVDNYKAELVRTDLFRAAALKGYFDPLDKVRGRGCWRDSDGGIVFHAGDRILYKNTWHRPGEIDDLIYTSKMPIGRPADTPSEAPRDGMALSAKVILGPLKSWNWERPDVDPYVYLGFMVSGRLGAALPARPPVWVTGEEGAGKSALFHYTNEFMCGGLIKGEGITAANIYQKLRDDCLAVLLDEKESEENRSKMTAILELVRISFTGGQLGRGGADGVPVNYTLRSSFLLSGIVQASLKPADESRMISLTIRKLSNEKATGEIYDKATIKQASADLFGRLIKNWKKFDPTLEAVRAHLATKGYDGRGQDSLGVIITCAHLAMFDHDIGIGHLMPDEMGLEWWSDRLPVPKRDKTWQHLYSHILQAPIDRLKHTGTPNIDAIIEEIYRPKDTEALDDPLPYANKKLRDLGMFVQQVPIELMDDARIQARKPVYELFIPNKHVGLKGFLSATIWGGGSGESGAWHSVLKQFPAHVARKSENAVRKNQAVAVRGYFVDLERAAEAFE